MSFLHNAGMPLQRDLPSTTALGCLLAAADGGSFTAAARAVHLTHGAVSRQVASLEAMLGVNLFERRHLRLVLTPTGHAYVAQVRTAVDLLRTAAAQAAGAVELGDGHLGGAALDVTEREPLPSDSKLWHAPNCIITPHIAGGGPNWARKASALLQRNAEAFSEGRTLENVVDARKGY